MVERAEHGELMAKILQLVPEDLGQQIRKTATDSKNARKDRLKSNAAFEQADTSRIVSEVEWDQVMSRLDSLGGVYKLSLLNHLFLDGINT